MGRQKQQKQSDKRRARLQASPAVEDETELYFAATTLQQQGKLDQASSLYCQILGINPHHFDALTHLAAICLQRANFAEAASLFELSLQINPRQPSAHSGLGAALQGLKRFDEALACYEKALALEPHNMDVFMQRAALLASRGASVKTA